MAIVYSSEKINAAGMLHWKSFASQNYFDPSGIFMGGLVCAPLLFTMFTVLIIYLLESSKLLIEMKRKEMMYKESAKRKSERQSDSKKTK